jgi:hypothetical protein
LALYAHRKILRYYVQDGTQSIQVEDFTLIGEKSAVNCTISGRGILKTIPVIVDRLAAIICLVKSL